MWVAWQWMGGRCPSGKQKLNQFLGVFKTVWICYYGDQHLTRMESLVDCNMVEHQAKSMGISSERHMLVTAPKRISVTPCADSQSLALIMLPATDQESSLGFQARISSVSIQWPSSAIQPPVMWNTPATLAPRIPHNGVGSWLTCICMLTWVLDSCDTPLVEFCNLVTCLHSPRPSFSK